MLFLLPLIIKIEVPELSLAGIHECVSLKNLIGYSTSHQGACYRSGYMVPTIIPDQHIFSVFEQKMSTKMDQLMLGTGSEYILMGYSLVPQAASSFPSC